MYESAVSPQYKAYPRDKPHWVVTSSNWNRCFGLAVNFMKKVDNSNGMHAELELFARWYETALLI